MTPINFSLPGFFKKTGAGASEFNENMPPITDDLSIYLDPDYAVFSDDGHTLAADGENIRQMWDRSATGNTMNQTTAISQPIYDTTTFGNGNAAIYAINDYLGTTTDLSVGVNDDYTLYMVYKKPSNSNIYYAIRGSAGYPRFEHLTTAIRFRDNQGGNTPWTYTDNTDLKVIAITLDRNITTNGEHKLYVNGAYTALRDYTINWDVDISRIFANSTYGMHYGSFLWYDGKHSASQVLQVSEWLGEKYDIFTAPITENLEFYINPDKEVYSDAGTTLATDGDSIRQINDSSGNDNTIEQSTASHQFEYVEDHFGTGKAAIYKDTAHGPHMDFASTLSIASDTTGGITFYTVYDKTNLSSISYLFGTTDNNFNRILEYNNHSIYIQDTDGDTHYASFTNSTDLAIRAFTLDTSTDIVSTYENGVLVDSKYISKTWGTFNFDSFWGGSNTSYIGDTLLFSDIHDADQVATMTNWLDAKYDILPKLPVTSDLEAHFAANSNETYSDAGTTLATDGDNIAQINDLSGYNNHLTQTTAANQLLFKDDDGQVAGGKYWKANSVDVMNLTSDILVDVSDGYTSFMVCKKDTTNRYAIGFGSDPVGQTAFWYSNGNVYVGSAPYPVVTASNSTDWVVMATRITHDGSVNTAEVWIDSTSQGTSSGFNYSSDSDLKSAFNRQSPLNKNDVEYAELLHYNTPLSDSDVVSVSNYLKTIHGIS